jgi:hypothetical protein
MSRLEIVNTGDLDCRAVSGKAKESSLRPLFLDGGERVLQAELDALGGVKAHMTSYFARFHRLSVALKLGQDPLARVRNRLGGLLARQQPLAENRLRGNTLQHTAIGVHVLGQGYHTSALGSFGKGSIEDDRVALAEGLSRQVGQRIVSPARYSSAVKAGAVSLALARLGS